MQLQSELNGRGEYILATGDAAANRLRILHDIYGLESYWRGYRR